MPDHPLFSVSVVTPEGPAFEGDAEMLIVPGAAGEIGVLAPGPGFFQVLEDRAIALVDDAVGAGEIDDARAQQQLEEAQAELEKLERGESTADRWQLEQRIRHAENQLRVSGHGG